jgi:WD40 repeat protein/uncharacterized caspase-like protein
MNRRTNRIFIWIHVSSMKSSLCLACSLLVLLALEGRLESSEVGAFDRPLLQLQRGYQEIHDLLFSPNGRLLASIGDVLHDGGRLKLWNVSTGYELFSLRTSRQYLNGLAFSEDGAHLASGNGGIVRIIDTRTGGIISELIIRRDIDYLDGLTAVAFQPNANILAIGGKNKICLWDLSKKEVIGKWVAYTEFINLDYIRFIGFNGDGSRLATYKNKEKRIRLWDANEGRLIKEFQTGHILAMGRNRNGDLVALSSRGNILLMLNLETQQVQTFAGHEGEIRIAAVAHGGDFLVSSANEVAKWGNLKIWDVSTGKGKNRMFGGISYDRLAINTDGRYVFAGGGWGGNLELWDASQARRIYTIEDRVKEIDLVALSPNGSWMAVSNVHGLQLWDLRRGRMLHFLPIGRMAKSLVFSPNSKELAMALSLRGIMLFDVEHGGDLVQVELTGLKEIKQLSYSPDGDYLAASDISGNIGLWHVSERVNDHSRGGYSCKPDGQCVSASDSDENVSFSFSHFTAKKLEWIYKDPERWRWSDAMRFSPKDNILFIANRGEITKIEWKTGKVIGPIVPLGLYNIRDIQISHDGKYLAATSESAMGIETKVIRLQNLEQVLTLREHDRVVFLSNKDVMVSRSTEGVHYWDTRTFELIKTVPERSGGYGRLSFSPDNRFAIEDAGAFLYFRDVQSLERWASMAFLTRGNWVVVTPEGLFDGTSSAWTDVFWRMSTDLYDVGPMSVFFNEFFYPDLLRDVLSGQRPRADLNMAGLDRRQPHVKLSSPNISVKRPVSDREIQVSIEVAEAPPDSAHSTGSGVRDVRLFRNGALVEAWKGDVLGNKTGATKLKSKIGIIAGENAFTAYAFNRANIKSQDATIVIEGADSLRRESIVYVIAIGINEYSNDKYNLNYAVADAEKMARVLKQSVGKRKDRQLRQLDDRVVSITLLNKEAQKGNILAALGRLSKKGKQLSLPPGAPGKLRGLTSAQPEDSVILFFSGHGMAKGDRYYLLPHDLGYKGDPKTMDDKGRELLLSKSISDRELEKALEHIDAERVMLIIDACQSGQALESEEKRRGPMNSRGLAQLAYEKGMYILAAAQSHQAALELQKLGHGLLTYTLIEEGLKQFRADNIPKDGQITAEEWLDHATMNVGRESDKARAEYAKKKGGEQIDGGEVTVTGQSPRAYYRRERRGDPWVVGRQ